MEEWKSIIDYDNYEISNFGNVRNIKTNQLLTPTINNNGYYRINLWKNNKYKTYLIHRLLAIEFIPNPNNYSLIDHIDRNPLNNKLDNLRWANLSQNNYNRKYNNLTSKYRGVYWDKRKNKWGARISINRKSIFLGRYETEEEGALAYNNMVIFHNLQEFVELNTLE